MKRILLTAAMLLPTILWAAATASYTASTGTGIIEYKNIQRVMHFSDERNKISAYGVILVCLPHSAISSSRCVDANGNNAWQDIANVDIPGHELAGFDYRLSGSGYRHIFLYFKKK